MITKYNLRGQTKYRITKQFNDNEISKSKAIRKWPDDHTICNNCGWEHITLEYANIDIECLSVFCPECGTMIYD